MDNEKLYLFFLIVYNPCKYLYIFLSKECCLRMSKLENIQKTLSQEGIDGWLFYSFRNSDPIASKILAIDKGHFTRRWFYYIPAVGDPVKIVHRIEEEKLNFLEGKKLVYLSWKELSDCVRSAIGKAAKVAMQYSPMNDIPYVSTVDAGTVELVRSFGCEVVSSAILVQKFESVWTERQKEQYIYAASALRGFVDDTFAYVRNSLLNGSDINEYMVQQHILSLFAKNGLMTDSNPVAAVNHHSADPHYEPTSADSAPIKTGDFLLIDLWAKKKEEKAVYADITWTCFVGDSVPDKYENVFQIVRQARDKVVDDVTNGLASGGKVYGWELDDAARNVIVQAGYGEYFIHRTGHSIGEEVHGCGANLDNLETRDSRIILPKTCFSVEPGIYLKGDFGVRTEIDVYIEENSSVGLYGLPFQEKVIPVLA